LKGAEIVVKDLIKVYRLGKVEVQALRGLSMAVKEGEVISIIGPSGSGKTTLLNIVGGLDTATAGIVTAGSIEVTALTTSQLIDFRRKTVGHIFQTLNLIPTLTAAENVELPMIALGEGRGKRKERVKQLLEVVGLTPRADHKPDELSGGEQQRVAMAAALANDAPIILADEPTGELDTTNAKIVVDYLVKISKELGKTIVMVTHDPNIARQTERILRIEDGTIKAALTPAQILEPTAAVSYVDQLRSRLADIDAQLEKLDKDFKQGKLGGDEYAEQRQRLKQTKAGLQDELHRMGVVI
jgi:putative ABC transport system ATP-binding protein